MRLFDKDWNCVYDSDTSDLTLEQFMLGQDWLNGVEDTPQGRWNGRVVNTDGVIEKHRDPFDPAAWMSPALRREVEAQAAAAAHEAWTQIAASFQALAKQAAEAPHVPKPSRTPPMWANDPTKSRRRR